MIKASEMTEAEFYERWVREIEEVKKMEISEYVNELNAILEELRMRCQIRSEPEHVTMALKILEERGKDRRSAEGAARRARSSAAKKPSDSGWGDEGEI